MNSNELRHRLRRFWSAPPHRYGCRVAASCLIGCLGWVAGVAQEPRLREGVFGSGGAFTTAGPYSVTDTIGESVRGVSEAGGSRIAAGFWALLGQPPSTTALRITTRPGMELLISQAKLAAAVMDPDGEAIAELSLAPESARGVPISWSAAPSAYRYLAPPTTDEDALYFRVVDAGGDTAQGVLEIQVAYPETPSLNLVRFVVSPQAISLEFAGIPNRLYVVQYATQITGPWDQVSPVLTSSPTGVVSFVDTVNTGSTQGFYRTLEWQ